MDYLLARWYAVKDLEPQRLKAFHNFEIAVKQYSQSRAKELKKQKIFMPLWWQEGALFLNKEFKLFWQAKSLKPAAIKQFKSSAQKIFEQNNICIKDGRIFEDIKFMHRCDLAINASPRASGSSSEQHSS